MSVQEEMCRIAPDLISTRTYAPAVEVFAIPGTNPQSAKYPGSEAMVNTITADMCAGWVVCIDEGVTLCFTMCMI
jgi:hypothetical protein